MQRFFFLVAAIHITLAVKPPNYVEKVPDKVSEAFKLLFRSAHLCGMESEISATDLVVACFEDH